MIPQQNIEFNITWCENNLRWLAGEPASEDRDRKIAFNRFEIERLNALLKG